jgi:hypothetical protein
MQSLGDEIDTILQQNPKTLSLEKNIKPDFMTNLKSMMRTKELNTKEAQKEINGYLSDLYDITGHNLGDEITTPELFRMKVDINSDYQKVKDKIDKGVALNAREKVISAARKTVDDIIANAHPDVKERTLLQSALYDAAPSLSRARFNPPTLRVAGTSIPGQASQKAAELGGAALQKTGGAMQGAAEALPPIMENPNLQRGIISVGGAMSNPPGNEPNGELGQGDNSYGNQNAAGNFQHDSSISNMPPITGYTSAELGDAYTKAVMAGDTGAATQLKKLYELQVASDKRNQPAKISAQTAKQKALASSGIRGVEEITRMLESDPSILAKSFLTPGNLLTRRYENAAFRAAEGILRSRSGAVINKDEIERYAKNFLPWFGDDEETINYKLQQAMADYNDMLMIYNADDSGVTTNTDTGIPEIQ